MSALATTLIVVIGGALGFMLAEWLLARVIRHAHETGALDQPTARGSHAIPTPRTGGLAIAPLVIGAACVVLLGRAFGHSDAPGFVAAAAWAMILGGAVAAAIGHRDDTVRLAVAPKLLGQLGAAILVALLLGRLDRIALGGVDLALPWPAAMLLTVFAVGALMNIVNFMDGMDGLVSAFALTCLGGFALMAFETAAGGELALVLAVFAGALIAFHRRNVTAVQADKTFLGDCGSQFIGLALAVLALTLPRAAIVCATPDAASGAAPAYDLKVALQTSGGAPRVALDLTAALILFLPFLYDTTLTMTRRALRGENVFAAHHQHLYQRQLELGDTHEATRLRWYRILAPHFVMAALVIWSGPATLAGRVALFLCPLPMILYHREILRRERAGTDPLS